MLDYVGLLGAGNEEMARFAWKAFAQWQQRHGGTPKDEAKKRKMYDFLTGTEECSYTHLTSTDAYPYSFPKYFQPACSTNSVPGLV